MLLLLGAVLMDLQAYPAWKRDVFSVFQKTNDARIRFEATEHHISQQLAELTLHETWIIIVTAKMQFVPNNESQPAPSFYKVFFFFFL